ncbi:hypothetical protein Hs30E_13850 [Lactococcus hodotermopsidis]|uniref:Uncharacterized protein n=1 Tax=Pseudolactococcus hodotermopsidis TaxID=2709157 RepID=A0A6A0BEB5_9LACT|nr:hypothetical protein [Lactococcus hodotermopsidis]GFH42834.1 hypothetical protein Hs30E_13850 [Lactococcus hodotermopsidis]
MVNGTELSVFVKATRDVVSLVNDIKGRSKAYQAINDGELRLLQDKIQRETIIAHNQAAMEITMRNLEHLNKVAEQIERYGFSGSAAAAAEMQLFILAESLEKV